MTANNVISLPSSTSSLQRFGLDTDFGLDRGSAIGDTIAAIVFESIKNTGMLLVVNDAYVGRKARKPISCSDL